MKKDFWTEWGGKSPWMEIKHEALWFFCKLVCCMALQNLYFSASCSYRFECEQQKKNRMFWPRTLFSSSTWVVKKGCHSNVRKKGRFFGRNYYIVFSPHFFVRLYFLPTLGCIFSPPPFMTHSGSGFNLAPFSQLFHTISTTCSQILSHSNPTLGEVSWMRNESDFSIVSGSKWPNAGGGFVNA